MPYKSKKVKAEKKDRYRTKVGSVCGSEKLIPNCPLQGKKEITGIHGTLRRTRTYPEYSGRVGANGSGRSGRIYKSASNDCINFPHFSKLSYGEQLPFVGCDNCTPWVVCTEHEAWLAIPGRANYKPTIEVENSAYSTQSNVSFVTPSKPILDTTPVSKGGRKKKAKGGTGRGNKIGLTPQTNEDFNKIIDDFNKELELSTPVSSRKRKIEMGETPKSKKGKKYPLEILLKLSVKRFHLIKMNL